jgi:MtaA/CmuA family methyltransferase
MLMKVESETMTSLERVEAVLHGGMPDRVPVGLANFQMVAQASGRPFPEFLQDGEAMAEGQIAAWRQYGHDVLILENGTASLAEACGCEVQYLEGSAPVVTKPAIASLDALDSLTMPDPYQNQALAPLLATTRIVTQAIGDRAFIIARADQGPFSLAGLLLGMENFLPELALGEHPEQLHRLLAFCTEVTYRYAVAQMEQGAHMTSIGESLSGPDVCSPRHYQAYEWPYACRLVERLRARGIRLSYHICGNATKIVPKMVETGSSILELDYKVDIDQIKPFSRGATTVMGPVDPSGVMALGSPELVEAKSREAIEVLGPGGGFILAPGCALPPKTPPANVHAMVEAARRYGRYQRGASHG